MNLNLNLNHIELQAKQCIPGKIGGRYETSNIQEMKGHFVQSKHMGWFHSSDG